MIQVNTQTTHKIGDRGFGRIAASATTYIDSEHYAAVLAAKVRENANLGYHFHAGTLAKQNRLTR